MKKTILLSLVVVTVGFARADANPPWAKCTCEEPASVPDGTSWAGGELSFTNRAANGGASFDFAALDAATFDGATIRFVDGTIPVDSLAFDPTRGLTFVGGAGTVLKGIADKSMFDGEKKVEGVGGGGERVVWTNLTFTCQEMTGFVRRNGGAIAVRGGGFTLTDCVFTNCFANQFGGAVYALLLTGDSMVTNCVFAGNWTSVYNGYGGAIYASAASEGVRLAVVDSAFGYNEAENGGAINTVRITDGNAEKPIGLEIRDTAFIENYGDYGGGAVFAEGDVQIEGGSEFEGNDAGFMGAALTVTGVEGYFTPATVRVGRGAVFTDNLVSNSTSWCYGGAIAILPDDCTLDVEGASFIGNVAAGRRRVLAYGGAIAMIGGEARIAACVFDGGPHAPDFCLGGAVDFDGTDAVICNSTFRRTGTEAICVTGAGLLVSNCVIVGNGLVDRSRYCDIYLEDADAEIVYTAYGTIDSERELITDWRNLADSETSSVYEGETLKLRSTGFNPVAALGVVQDALDIEGVPYGSKPAGYSMGAYETATEALVVHLDGEKVFDGTTSSNDCTWTWSLTDANGAAATWEAIEPLEETFALTNWTFASRNVGAYCSTNEEGITAAVVGDEWKRQGLFFLFTGLITPRPVTLTSGSEQFTYDKQAHSNLTVTAENFVAGEGVTTNNFATITDVGSCPNSFEYAFAAGTLAANYHVTVVTGVLTVVKGPLPPEDDPDPIDPNVDPTDPEQREDPDVRFSKYDYVGVYDGEFHTIDTNALKAAYLEALDEEISCMYAREQDGVWQDEPLMFKDAVVTAFWYKVSSANYADIVRPCKVVITNRCVTLTSGSEQFTYDKQAHSNLTVTAENFVAGEGVTTNNFATITDVGTCPNSFEYAFADGTLAANYHVTVVTGTLTVVQGPLPPEDDPDPIDPSVDPDDPGQREDPDVRFSKYDYVGVYDGEFHTIDTDALKAAYLEALGEEISCMYAREQDGVWQDEPLMFKDAVVTAFWYKVSSANYADIVRPCKVVITNRCVTLTSGSEQFTYDKQAHSNLTVTAENFVAGEGVTTNNFATITDVGTCPNSFEYAFADGTFAANYHVTVVTGVLTVVQGPLPPEDDPDPIDPNVDPTDPEQREDPDVRFSKYDYVGVYDGEFHTIDTNALKAAYLEALDEEISCMYAREQDGVWQDEPLMFKDAVVTAFWYKVSSANYADIVRPCKVVITNRCVTLTSGSEQFTYDKQAHSNLTVTAENFVAGEGVTTNNFATITDVGTCPNSFEYAFADGTLAANYHVTVVTGTLTVVQGPLPPEDDPDPINPDVDPTDPEQREDPDVRFSKYDYVGVYDGKPHTIDTNALWSAYLEALGGEISCMYAREQDGVWQDEPLMFKDAVVTAFWYKVSSANYADIIRPCKVVITPRPVTFWSESAVKIYDGKPLTTNEVKYTVMTDEPQPYLNLKRLGAYIYEAHYDTEYPEDAEDYYEHRFDGTAGGCLSFRVGDWHARNYDWKFDEMAEFVVHMTSNETRHASVGIANVGVNITEEIARHGEWSKFYRALPGMMTDGMNDAGLVMNVNVVHSDGQEKTKWKGTTLNAFAAIRYCLDNFADAKTAADYLAANVYIPENLIKATDFAYHWMISDASGATYVVEDGVAHLMTDGQTVSNVPVMSNYRLFATADGAANYDRKTVGAYDPYGAGIERSKKVANQLKDINGLLDAMTTLESVWYTKAFPAHEPFENPFWYTEFSNKDLGVTITNSNDELFAIAQTQYVEYRRDHDAEGPFYRQGLTWQTVHSSVYDVAAKKLYLRVQEDNANIYEIPLEVGEAPLLGVPGFGTGVSAALSETGLVPGDAERISFEVTGSQTEVGSSANDYEIIWGDVLESNYIVTKDYGWLTVYTADIDPTIDPYPLNPAVDPTDPAAVEDPSTVFSICDCVAMYDGEGHTIIPELLAVAYGQRYPLEGLEIGYSFSSNGTYSAAAPVFTNVTATSLWYRVKIPQYNDFVHPCKVLITNRVITLTSPMKEKPFDATPLTFDGSEITVGGNGFVAGESFVYSDFASITEEGSTPATFSYAAGPNTLLSNYGVIVSTGLLTITYAPDPRPTEWDMWPTEYDRAEYAFVENWTMVVTNPPNVYFSVDSLAWRLGFVVRWPGGTGRYLKPEEATFKLSTNGREYSCAEVLAGRTGGELLTVQTNRAGYVEFVTWEVEITPEDVYEAHDLDGLTEFSYTMTATAGASTRDFNLIIPLGNLELVDINGYRVYPVHLHTWATNVINGSRLQVRCVSDPWYELRCVFAGETIELKLGKNGKFDEAELDEFRWKTGAYVSDVVIANGYYEARVIFMGANTVVLRQPAPAQIIGGLEFSNVAVGKDVCFRIRARSGGAFQTTRLAKEAIVQSLRSTTDLTKGFTDRVPADRIKVDEATGAVTVTRDPKLGSEFFMLVVPTTAP